MASSYFLPSDPATYFTTLLPHSGGGNVSDYDWLKGLKATDVFYFEIPNWDKYQLPMEGRRQWFRLDTGWLRDPKIHRMTFAARHRFITFLTLRAESSEVLVESSLVLLKSCDSLPGVLPYSSLLQLQQNHLVNFYKTRQDKTVQNNLNSNKAKKVKVGLLEPGAVGKVDKEEIKSLPLPTEKRTLVEPPDIFTGRWLWKQITDPDQVADLHFGNAEWMTMECEKAASWCNDQPDKRHRTKVGWSRFMKGWLNRAHQQSPPSQPKSQIVIDHDALWAKEEGDA